MLLPGDLREADEVLRDLEGAGFRPELPTLIIAECVLVYMPPESAERLISELGRRLPTAAFLVYEQVGNTVCTSLHHAWPGGEFVRRGGDGKDPGMEVE